MPGFLRPFGYRHSLLEPSCARCGIPPSSRSAYQEQLRPWTTTGLSRSTSDRYDRVGCPLYPGDGGAFPPGQVRPGGTCRLPAAGPYLPLKLPIGGSDHDEASTRVHAIHPSGLPQPVTPGWNKGPSAFHLGLRTPRLPATHAEAGTAPTHGTGNYTIDIDPPSVSCAVLMRLRVARRGSSTMSWSV